MPHANRIINLKVVNVSFNGTVNMGSAIHKGYAAGQEATGNQLIIGDRFESVVARSFNFDLHNDPDAFDQMQKQR